MFHRVRSGLHENEQNEQSGSVTNNAIAENKMDFAAKENAENEENASSTDAPVFDATYLTQTQQQKEKAEMEETIVQGKYARDTETRSETQASGYARSVAPPISRSSTYPGSYSASPAPASAVSSQAPTAPQTRDFGATATGERCLRIGRGINMSGEIEACDHLLVEGTVEAALKGAKILEIAESGTFYGTVEIEEATIAGRFEGDITVNGRLTISSTGTITGSIAYRELEVEAGAMLDGRMTPLKNAATDAQKFDTYRPTADASSAIAKAKEIVSKKAEPANTEHGLFSKAHAR